MLDIADMTPAHVPVKRGFATPAADYYGGKLHGLLSGAGLHELRRDENSRGIDADTASRVPHYQLYVDGSVVHYVHNSLLPPPGNDQENNENDSDDRNPDPMQLKKTARRIMDKVNPWRTVNVVPLPGTWTNRYRTNSGEMILDPCPAVLVQERGGETRATFATFDKGFLFPAVDTAGYEESSCSAGRPPHRADKAPWEMIDEIDPEQKVKDEMGKPVGRPTVGGVELPADREGSIW
ncbi:MAG: hypothetical protein WAL99_01375 [Pseudonocardiaceae bacterium]